MSFRFNWCFKSTGLCSEFGVDTESSIADVAGMGLRNGVVYLLIESSIVKKQRSIFLKSTDIISVLFITA